MNEEIRQDRPENTSAMTEMGEWLEMAPSSLRRGDIVRGTIVRITPTEILVDIGMKAEGVITGRELERMPREIREVLREGDVIQVQVVNPEDRSGNILLSLQRALMEEDWQQARRLMQDGEILELTVNGYNKGGLVVKVGRLRGFIPASHVVPQESGEEKLPVEQRLKRRVGQRIYARIIEADPEANRLILSERAAQQDLRRRQKEELLARLEPGMRVRGRVISLADFGAFIDLGGADGLIHISELSWHRVSHPREILSVGQEIEVEVISVDRERKRIALSRKRVEPDPWQQAVSQLREGQLVEAVITRLTNFGAFAALKEFPGVEGLIHISELAEHRVHHPKEVVREGEELVVRLIRIDQENRRLALSLRRVSAPEYAMLDWEMAQARLQAGEEKGPEEPA
ncbi:MAG: S1 RNA-binding domain-containing protein [Thermoflexus sp.]|uniref:30S ribosomal protein S1 n=1 Tax=Thermoflexus sp. TaxID=1969742 RepID=UPI0025E71916|nr:S1 RNA-binding domain-containing protein [Thermoflexus sp.]MCS6963768.1 S1 RNA-binding domain-containing protein [Thermoflexus sp.]MDW8184316.1 S1 RNA-binding domain-containing protein [Anaerolineae bacterium]